MKEKAVRALLHMGIAALLTCAFALILTHLNAGHNLDSLVLSVPSSTWDTAALSYGDADSRVNARLLDSGAEDRVNVNTATAAELDKLPGIGEKTALNLIEERGTHGRFSYPADLLNVKGIGEKTLEKIIDFICFD